MIGKGVRHLDRASEAQAGRHHPPPVGRVAVVDGERHVAQVRDVPRLHQQHPWFGLTSGRALARHRQRRCIGEVGHEVEVHGHRILQAPVRPRVVGVHRLFHEDPSLQVAVTLGRGVADPVPPLAGTDGVADLVGPRRLRHRQRLEEIPDVVEEVHEVAEVGPHGSHRSMGTGHGEPTSGPASAVAGRWCRHPGACSSQPSPESLRLQERIAIDDVEQLNGMFHVMERRRAPCRERICVGLDAVRTIAEVGRPPTTHRHAKRRSATVFSGADGTLCASWTGLGGSCRTRTYNPLIQRAGWVLSIIGEPRLRCVCDADRGRDLVWGSSGVVVECWLSEPPWCAPTMLECTLRAHRVARFAFSGCREVRVRGCPPGRSRTT